MNVNDAKINDMTFMLKKLCLNFLLLEDSVLQKQFLFIDELGRCMSQPLQKYLWMPMILGTTTVLVYVTVFYFHCFSGGRWCKETGYNFNKYLSWKAEAAKGIF